MVDRAVAWVISSLSPLRQVADEEVEAEALFSDWRMEVGRVMAQYEPCGSSGFLYLSIFSPLQAEEGRTGAESERRSRYEEECRKEAWERRELKLWRH